MRAMLRLSVLMSFTACAACAGEIELDSPTGGWRHTAGEHVEYSQAVSYPAVRVNTPQGQSITALIKGRIKNAAKTAGQKNRAPYTLIANGASMPQRVEEDGEFERPYAFTAGSNSVEMRSPDGTQRKRVQFYDSHAGKTSPKLRIILSWDSDGTDLDLHVVTPEGEHAFYGNRVLPNGGALDVDVTTGYGPEIFSSPAPTRGTYLVYVNYYGSGSNDQDLTVAKVTVISNENTPNEKQQSFPVPMRKQGELTLVKSFVF